MSHPEEGMFHAWLDGELSPEEVRAIEAHVASCPACAARLAEARAIFDESTELVERLEVPDRVVTRAAAVSGHRPRGTRPWALTGPRVRAVAWAATVVIAAGAGYLAGDWRHRVPGQLSAPVSAEAGRRSTVATEEVTSPGDETRVTTETDDGKDIAAGRAAPPGAPEEQQAPDEGIAVPSTPEPVDVVGGAVAGGAPVGKLADQVEAPGARRDRLAQRETPERREAGRAANEPTVPPPAAALEAPPRRALVSELAQDARREQDFAKAAHAAPAEAFRTEERSRKTVTLEQAVDALNGAIRLVDGASLTRVETIDPPAVPWGEAMGPQVEVTYRLEGAEVVLSQVRVNPNPAPSAEGEGAAGKLMRDNRISGMVPTLAPGDTLVVAEPGGGYRVWWLDGSSRVLSLSGPLGREALKRIVDRIR